MGDGLFVLPEQRVIPGQAGVCSRCETSPTFTPSITATSSPTSTFTAQPPKPSRTSTPVSKSAAPPPPPDNSASGHPALWAPSTTGNSCSGQPATTSRSTSAPPTDTRPTRTSGPEGTASFFKQNRADTPAGLPLYITEVNVSSTNAPKLDKSEAAASFLRTVIESTGVVDALAIWTFSDIYEELTQADNPFHGGFGLQTIHGVKKPLYRLLEIMHTVGDRKIPLTLTGAPDTVGGIAVTGRSGTVDVLLYNHMLAGPNQPAAEPATITVALPGTGGSTSARIQLIDEDHTNPYRQWLELGSPDTPIRLSCGPSTRPANCTAKTSTSLVVAVEKCRSRSPCRPKASPPSASPPRSLTADIKPARSGSSVPPAPVGLDTRSPLS